MNCCPSCGSTKVWVGNFVLSCDDCKWHYLNKYPCSVCGRPSTSTMGVNGVTVNGCNVHPARLSMRELWNLK